MTNDLVKRLRETTHMYQVDCELKMKCADRIEALEAENAELKAKVAKAVDFVQATIRYAGNSGDDFLAACARIALAELKGDSDDK